MSYSMWVVANGKLQPSYYQPVNHKTLKLKKTNKLIRINLICLHFLRKDNLGAGANGMRFERSD